LKKILFVLLIVMFMVPATVMASLVVNREPGYYSGNGGEFTLSGGAPSNMSYADSTKNIGSWGPSFQTFCLETDEYVSLPNGTYNYALNSMALRGGTNTDAGDPLSKGAAWLYSQFAKGTLSGYGYNSDRASWAGSLQSAIRGLEDEQGYSVSSYWLNVLQTQGGFADLAAAKADAGVGEYGVFVLNLTTAGGGYAQDMLYYKGSGNNVPIPPTAYLLGAGLVGLVGLRRRFKK